MSIRRTFVENSEPPLDLVGSQAFMSRIPDVPLDRIMDMLDVDAGTAANIQKTFDLAHVTDQVHLRIADVEELYFKKADRAEALGLSQAYRDVITARGDSQNDAAIKNLEGLKAAVTNLKSSWSAADKTSIDNTWASDKAAIKAGFDNLVEEACVDFRQLEGVRVANLVTMKNNTYTEMDGGVDSLLQKMIDSAQQAITLRQQPDRGMVPDPGFPFQTKLKTEIVSFELMLIALLYVICSKNWVFCVALWPLWAGLLFFLLIKFIICIHLTS